MLQSCRANFSRQGAAGYNCSRTVPRFLQALSRRAFGHSRLLAK